MADSSPGTPQPPTSGPVEEGYRVTPLDPTPREELYEKPFVAEVVVEDDDDAPAPKQKRRFAPERFQFTLRDMLLLMTGVAVWLGIMTTLRWSWSLLAGLAGVAAFVSLVFLTVAEPENPNARFVWWCILGLYGLTCFCAIIASF